MIRERRTDAHGSLHGLRAMNCPTAYSGGGIRLLKVLPHLGEQTVGSGKGCCGDAEFMTMLDKEAAAVCYVPGCARCMG